MLSATNLIKCLMSLINQLGYLGIFAIIGLEYACFPIPSEIVLPFIGLKINQTNLQFLFVFLISILAGLMGSWICYLIGKLGGTPLLNWLSNHSKNAAKAFYIFNRWFNRYGDWAVLLTRVIPLTRTYISIFAGINHMPFGQFILYSSVGIALWNLILLSLGFYIGNNLSLINALMRTYTHLIIYASILIFLGLLTKKYLLTKKKS
ncbi:DedA family protein [Cellulosilyticum sp. I15G10I2]|uniref:DedA family protein n=1 Tax=Cellulosilyticum sp. I15G10I2 TaxID=1892843 RepID=UPI00085C64FC|nr:DedA family protein [Cellulosilyticum sp. I15G10I2]